MTKICNEHRNDTKIINESLTPSFYFVITVALTRIIPVNFITNSEQYSIMIHKDPSYISCSFQIFRFVLIERQNNCEIYTPFQTHI